MGDTWLSVKTAGPWARAGTDPTDEEAEIVFEVQEVALAYKAGTMPLRVALEATTFRTRFLAVKFTALGTERWMAMMTLVNDACLDRGDWFTPHGIITQTELREGCARQTTEGGRRVCLFAAGYDKEGNPWYRTPEQRHPFRGQFREVPMKPPEEDDQASLPWYDRLEPSER